MYFTETPSLREIEKAMKMVPNFTPRGHGVVILCEHEFAEKSCIGDSQKEILARTVSRINNPLFQKRFQKYINESETIPVNFRNSKHSTTFTDTIRKKNKKDYALNPKYSFHWNGTSDRLYVFEAPIDLLSFLTLYPKDWQRHSYVALCGVGEQAMLWMLEQAPEFRRPILCLDHDAAGIEATGRLKEILAERGYAETAVLQSIHKDWNEDVKARCGLEAQSAEEHPQLMAAPEVCKRVCAMSTTVKLDRLNIEVPWLIEQYRTHLHWGQFDQAMDCMEQASALAVAACRRELRQLGMAATEDELTKLLCERIRPHRNRGSLKKRHRELAPQFQSVLALEDAVGLRTQEEKKTLAGRWLELAAAFAGVPIQYEAEQIKQRETQPTLNMELGVTL